MRYLIIALLTFGVLFTSKAQDVNYYECVPMDEADARNLMDESIQQDQVIEDQEVDVDADARIDREYEYEGEVEDSELEGEYETDIEADADLDADHQRYEGAREFEYTEEVVAEEVYVEERDRSTAGAILGAPFRAAGAIISDVAKGAGYIIRAPFRGVAKLFGGGRDRDKEHSECVVVEG
ncbi:MAG: hypothetical protein ACK40G_03205 [Cytophagaceae bacterium]